MKSTTVYLDEHALTLLAVLAAKLETTSAELIREGVSSVLNRHADRIPWTCEDKVRRAKLSAWVTLVHGCANRPDHALHKTYLEMTNWLDDHCTKESNDE